MQNIKTIKTKRKRLSKKLKKFLSKNGFTNISDALKSSTSQNDYFDFSNTQAGKISYIKKSRMPQKLSNIYDADYRISYGTHAKIGKLIDINNEENPYAQKELNQELVTFSEVIFTHQAKMKVILTNEICKYYNVKNNCPGGLLSNSCMRHDRLQDAIKFYELLGESVVKLAVIFRDNKIIARALIWQNVKTAEDDFIYMDRVYAIDSLIEAFLYKYAAEKGWRSYKCSFEGRAKIRIPAGACVDTDTPLPYCDTFQGMDADITYLTNRGDDVTLDSVYGASVNTIDEDVYHCESCDVSMNDCCYSEIDSTNYCSDCASYSDYQETYILNENAYYSEAEHTYFHCDNEDFVRSDYCNDYILQENAVYSDYCNDYIPCDDAVQDVNGNYILCDAATYDDETGEYYTSEDYDYLIEERGKNEKDEN
ncbi:MAG: hypothetical protein JRJ39_02835 [Deltaproteobacteria bacterium]|nr:hypothetical protein [Deltaproteobacteria bacterium]